MAWPASPHDGPDGTERGGVVRLSANADVAAPFQEATLRAGPAEHRG
jgi:hypothetical protein